MFSAAGNAGSPFGIRHVSLSVSPITGWSLLGAALVVLLGVAAGAALLGDPDTQWHIAVGQWIAANGRMPQTDTFSHTFAGQPWIAKEWLSQLLLMAAYALGGWPGVVMLTAVSVAVALYLVMAECGRSNGPAWGLLVGLFAVPFIVPTMIARPHVLAFPVIVLWTISLVRGAEARLPPWRALPLLVLWVNLHAGFTAGLLMAAALGLDAVLRADAAARRTVIVRWAMFGIACLAATLVTPYGIKPLLVSASVVGGSESMELIAEWQPLKLNQSAVLLLSVAGLCLFALAQRPRQNAARFLLVGILTYMMIRHSRFTMLFGLVAPLLAGASVFQLVQTVARRLDLLQKPLLPDAKWTPHLAGGALALSLALLLIFRPAPPVSVAPVAALASVPADVRRQPVFNSYDYGGFLVLNGVKTFIDGRTDQLFLGGFMSAMMRASSASEPEALERLLDRHHVAWAIIKADASEAEVFARLAGWKSLYKDDAAHVYVRDGGRSAP